MNTIQQPQRDAWWVISNSLCVVVLGYWASVLVGVASDFRDISRANSVLREAEEFAQLPKVTDREVVSYIGRRFRDRGLERFYAAAVGRANATPVPRTTFTLLSPATAE